MHFDILFFFFFVTFMGFSGSSDGKESGFDPWDGKIPLEKGMTTHSIILALRFHGQRSLVGYSP